MSNLSTGSAADETTEYITAKFREGVSRTAIIESLVAAGWSHSDADTAVTSTERLLQRRGGIPAPAAPVYPQSYGGTGSAGGSRTSPARAAAVRRMSIGACWCIGGIAITAITYGAAEGGGVYIVCYGAIVWGFIDVIRGLIDYMNAD